MQSELLLHAAQRLLTLAEKSECINPKKWRGGGGGKKKKKKKKFFFFNFKKGVLNIRP